ncbi:MAG TPA: protein-methionine-sulfoxide reductase heme-binding subunit MsrQ [Candidatus Acidoferrum sp.]|jgi:sulfoxide reductase heme-binding subunit YedZ|nr:protein-methionine-sulfoxide reductase heme-binding subunit MsrQ [Candidatus Acidoferrum sp.]
MDAVLKSKWTKAFIFLLCLVPFGLIAWTVVTNTPPNPIEFITHGLGDWTIRFVCITLAITPLRDILRQPQLIRFRRMMGLYAFFYGSMHFGTWIFDKFSLTDMSHDIVKRPFITVGFAAYALMIPLAITSTKGMVRRLGFKRWQMLHRLIYFTAILAVIHYWWLVKSDVHRPERYGALVAVLLLWRIGTWLRDRQKGQKQPARTRSREAAPQAENA